MFLTKCIDSLDDDFVNPLENSPYPEGLVCAAEIGHQSCFATGDSGAPLMLKEENSDRFYTEGILSFVKGCTFGVFPLRDFPGEFYSKFSASSPAAYTKLSCYLPWVAEQYGLDYTAGAVDPKCVTATGDKNQVNVTNCLTRSSIFDDSSPYSEENRYPCLFPFYKDGKLYDSCIYIEQQGYILPLYFCPQRNITTKIDGINHYMTQDRLTHDVVHASPACQDPSAQQPGDREPPVNPDINITDCAPENIVFFTYQQCNNNCKGGKEGNL